MSNGKNAVTISLSTPLFLLFLILKLTNTITWSWWWVAAPLWMPFVFFAGVTGFLLCLALIVSIFSTRR